MRATVADTQSLIQVRNLAFYNDYIKYGECPGYNRPYEVMKRTIETAFVFKIIVDGEIIGDISAKNIGDEKYHLGCLSVIPKYENLGIGQKSIAFLDDYFTDAKTWSLETPIDNKKNQYFYKKCGFEITGEFMDGNVRVVVFEKNRVLT